MNNVRREASKHFRNKKREYLKHKINELATNSKNKNSFAFNPQMKYTNWATVTGWGILGPNFWIERCCMVSTANIHGR
jgi:hypothetical protein